MSELPENAAPVLTGIARAAIGERLGIEVSRPEGAPWLSEPGASFVTLTIDGRLRGCIGSLEAYRGLGKDVADNAVSAGFRDPRFPPLEQEDFQKVHIEVSVLSAPTEMSFTSEEDALSQLRPGIDGLILTSEGHRATFLPQVWEDLEHPIEFLNHLKRKAGLRFNHWSPDVRLWRYTVTAFHEDD
jgi:AmmeMemoRadiSam system protein A